jgi:nicotinamidase/pyrazinamidase
MRTVFVDIDSQLDFLFPSGALYVPGAERILGSIARLNRFAAAQGMPVVSTTDAHAENDPEFAQWPHHCIAGTTGQHKAESTLLERRVVVPSGTGPPAGRQGGAGFSLPTTGQEAGPTAQQIIVEKQTVDVFQAPNLTRVLDGLKADHYVLYGVVTEICVLYAARGLLQRGQTVEVVADAIEALTPEGSRRAIEEIVAGGGRLATVEEITGGCGR